MIYLNQTLYTKTVIFVNLSLKNQEAKKNHMFFFHYGQMGGIRGNRQLPINILKRGLITYYTISYDQHKNYYDFFNEQIVDNFLSPVYNKFNPDKNCKIQGYAEIINQQQGEFIVVESTRVWLTNTFTAKHFNEYVRSSIKGEIVKRIIINSQTGSSWYFRRFNRLTVITTSVNESNKIFSG